MSGQVIAKLDANTSFSFRPSGDISAEDKVIYASSQAIMRREVNFNVFEMLGFTGVRLPAGHVKIPVERTVKAASEISANFSEHLRFKGTGEQWDSVTTRWRRFEHDEAWFAHQESLLNIPAGAAGRAHMRTMGALKRAEFCIGAQELHDGYNLVGGGRRPFYFAIGAGYAAKFSKEGRRLADVVYNAGIGHQGLNFEKLRKAIQLLFVSGKAYPGNAIAIGNYIEIEDGLSGDQTVTRFENLPESPVMQKGYNGMGFNGQIWQGEKAGVRIIGAPPLEGGGDAYDEDNPKQGQDLVLKQPAFPTVDSDPNILGGVACLSAEGAEFIKKDAVRKLVSTVNGVVYSNARYSAEGSTADNCINKATGEVWQGGDFLPPDFIFKAAGTFSARKVGRNAGDTAAKATDPAARFMGEKTWNLDTKVKDGAIATTNDAVAIISGAGQVTRVYFFPPNMMAATVPGDAPQYEFYPGMELNKNHFKGLLTYGNSILDPECFGMVEIASPYPGIEFKNVNPNA